MAAQAQDARAEADRLESVSAEQRERAAAERADVEDSLRKADRIDPDVRNRTTADTAPRRATDETYDDDVQDRDVSDRAVRDDVEDRDVNDRAFRDDVEDRDAGDRRVRDDVSDPTVRDDNLSSPRRSLDDDTLRDDVRHSESGDRTVVEDERSTDPRR